MQLTGFRRLLVAMVLALVVAVVPAANVHSAECFFQSGFKTLHDLIPDIVGSCTTNEMHNPENGDGLQLTDAFIAAAVRCAPPGNKPTTEEIANCLPHLDAEIAALPNGQTLIGCYHPSRQNTNTGKLTAPMMNAVFVRARRALGRARRA